jgi:hypothetical protein
MGWSVFSYVSAFLSFGIFVDSQRDREIEVTRIIRPEKLMPKASEGSELAVSVQYSNFRGTGTGTLHQVGPPPLVVQYPPRRRIQGSAIKSPSPHQLASALMPATPHLLSTKHCACHTCYDKILPQKQQGRGASGWSIHREYRSDRTYMAIDHEYDYLWNEETDARKALIYLSPQEQAAERPEVGSITM